MRKLFKRCLIAGAATCCALGGTAAYVWRCPDSALGRFVLSAMHKDSPVPGHPEVKDVAELIPPDPEPVDDPSDQPAVPALPGTSSQLPPAVAALIPPIIIHDEEDLNGSSSNAEKTESPAVVTSFHQTLPPSVYDVEEIGRRLDADVAVEPKTAPLRMPRCSDDADALPVMPPCTDDDTTPIMPPPGDDGALNRERNHPAAWTWWLGFFSGPSMLTLDPTIGRCEEDPHYGEQYPGAPYTCRPCSTDEPAPSNVKTPPPFPNLDEEPQPPAPKAVPHSDLRELFNRSHKLPMPQVSQPQSDTMEMRPSDWKPYSLDPGPF
ncbi:MAG TPA: hypothetical protein VMS17_12000 [Gemmataceae bacterium]|nr:hypothetical protein [Gemmataceae bacterium]